MIDTKEHKESTQPSKPSAFRDISEPTTQRKSTVIIPRKKPRCKVIARRRRVAAAIVSIIVIAAFFVLITSRQDKAVETAPEMGETKNETETSEPDPDVILVYFRAAGAEETTPVDIAELTSSWAAEYGTAVRYEITDEERWDLASVVEAEAGAEIFAGKEAVAQCILQACEDDGIRPTEVYEKYRYTTRRPEPSKESLLAVSAVFDFGWGVTYEPIKYFYAPARTESKWHESQVYVCTIGGHRFFREEGAENGTIHGQDFGGEN